MIQPVQKHLLVELRSAYQHLGHTTEERYGTSKTRGIVRALANDITPDVLKEIGAQELKVGDTVFFGKYEDTAPITIGSEDYILIKLEEIGGFDAADQGTA